MEATNLRVDRPIIVLYLLLLTWGWFSIYAAEYDVLAAQRVPFWDLGTRAGKQLMWIGSSAILICFHFLMHYRFYESFSYLLYALGVGLLIAVLFFGEEVSGSRSWFVLGSFRLQPSEVVKYATIMALARFLSPSQRQPNRLSNQLCMFCLMGLPILLIVWQGDTGTALVYSSLLFLMYRGGMSPIFMLIVIYCIILIACVLLIKKLFLITGIIILALVLIALSGKHIRRILFIVLSAGLTIIFAMGLDFAMQRTFKAYQYKRIQSLINPETDPFGTGWNVTQSKIAIGAGGLTGKGYLKGTQTKFDFVPEKTTDFIFCTIGEEFGWLGTFGLLVLFVLFILRIIKIAERQNSRYAMLFGHGLAAVIAFHFVVNISMTIGFFSCGGHTVAFYQLWGVVTLEFHRHVVHAPQARYGTETRAASFLSDGYKPVSVTPLGNRKTLV